MVEVGLDIFGDLQADTDGNLLTHAQTIRNVVEEAVLADEVGFDVFGIGEHHREDYAVSAPDMLLAAIAARTANIHLTTSVIVLSSDDPVRIFERFSTLQAISNGRAEMQLGRGSFTESFPLFDYDLRDYEALFEEKLDLVRTLLDADRTATPFSWAGSTRVPLERAAVCPRTDIPLPDWVAVGGSPESVVRAARQRVKLLLAIIGGAPVRFKPLVDLYHRVNKELGEPRDCGGTHVHGFVAATDEEAAERIYPHWHRSRTLGGRDRGWSEPTREQFVNEVRHGALHPGSPETVVRKRRRERSASSAWTASCTNIPTAPCRMSMRWSQSSPPVSR